MCDHRAAARLHNTCYVGRTHTADAAGWSEPHWEPWQAEHCCQGLRPCLRSSMHGFPPRLRQCVDASEGREVQLLCVSAGRGAGSQMAALPLQPSGVVAAVRRVRGGPRVGHGVRAQPRLQRPLLRCCSCGRGALASAIANSAHLFGSRYALALYCSHVALSYFEWLGFTAPPASRPRQTPCGDAECAASCRVWLPESTQGSSSSGSAGARVHTGSACAS